MSEAPVVKVSGLRKRFGSGPLVLDGIDLEVARGEFVSFIGPSGCGKSTLLGLVGALDRNARSAAGRQRVGGIDQQVPEHLRQGLGVAWRRRDQR